MRPALRIVRRVDAVVLTAVPWWRAPWLVTTGKVLWWVLTFGWWLAVAVVGVAVALISAVMFAMGIMAQFVGGRRA
jgi:hypothetical protein